MADYPAVGISRDSFVIEANNGTELSRGSDGTPWIRILYSETRYTINLTHALLTWAEQANLKSFYEVNKRNRVNFTDPNTGERYSCFMLHPPIQVARHNTQQGSMRMTLTGELIV